MDKKELTKRNKQLSQENINLMTENVALKDQIIKLRYGHFQEPSIQGDNSRPVKVEWKGLCNQMQFEAFALFLVKFKQCADAVTT